MPPNDQNQNQNQDGGQQPPEESFYDIRSRAIATLQGVARRDDLAQRLEYEVLTASDLLEQPELLHAISEVEHFGSFVISDFEPHLTKAREEAEAEAAAEAKAAEDSDTAEARKQLQDERTEAARENRLAAARRKLLDDEKAAEAAAGGTAPPPSTVDAELESVMTEFEKFDASPDEIEEKNRLAEEAIALHRQVEHGEPFAPDRNAFDNAVAERIKKLREGS
jgi:hypothetical protein